MEITARAWRDMIISAAHNLENNKQAVNDLNVFPVPDGDTGTNMSLTLNAALPRLDAAGSLPLGDLAAEVANALIRGARGNSGVILSLLFRGISRGLKGRDTADGAALAEAVQLGVEAAYKAVMKPTEGTILTVARLSAAAACKSAEVGGDAVQVFNVMTVSAREALARTPEMLPVLKQAGVVDAGGQGLLVIYEGMLSALKDGVIIASAAAPEKAPESTPDKTRADFEGFDSESIHFAYCTEFIIDKADRSTSADDFRSYLHTIGDCVVVVDADDFIKTHVHTNNPGLALEAAVAIGRLSKIKIENMREQHTALLDVAPQNAADAPAPADAPASVPVEKKYGFVAVAAGDGFEEVFRDLGADRTIKGGQTMNPSTEDILQAINHTPASTVFVLPNNKNIIMAAQQCVGLAEDGREVVILPTKTVPQGITAMLSFDETADTAANAEAMTAAAGTVKTLAVTYAARDSVFDGTEIKKGQYLGLIDGKVSQVHTSLKECVSKTADAALTGGETFVSVFYGQDTTEKQAATVSKALSAKLGDGAEVNVIKGGQPVYYFIISIE